MNFDKKSCKKVNPRIDGVADISSPLRFFMNSEKNAARSASKFCMTVHLSIFVTSASGDLLQFKVRSPGHLE